MGERWAAVEAVLPYAKGMSFDGCHKIYILMDDEQVAQSIKWDYEIEPVSIEQLREWYEDSCSLRFINAVSTNHADPNAGYNQIIPQGAEEEDVW
jgi:hypothetical protein